MKLILGLGNPGKEYERTRHNAGFMVVDHFVISSFSHFDSWVLEKKFKSEVCEASIDGQKVLLAKPQTFMNSSGEAVAALVNYHKIDADDVLVIHDDLDLSLGSFKLQKGTGPKGHNGVLSVENCLGVKGFWRLRVGINARVGAIHESPATGEEYVLNKFTTEELSTLSTLRPQLIQKINSWLQS